MRSSLRQMSRLMNKRSRSGQSIILVAFAFIALIAFVGIATDVALLFVRYSTLRRAVDAAAIAAAGQVRENANYLTLNAVAQQFIQVHGLNANTVRVETCDTEIADWMSDTLSHPGATYTSSLAALVARANEQLCKSPPQKLVRVSAQVQSDTAFLALLGWRSVMLEADAISQTAALDVAIVLDTSLSEALDTRAFEDGSVPGTLYPCKDETGTVRDCGFILDPLNPQPATNNDSLRRYRYFTNQAPYKDIYGAQVLSGHPAGEPDGLDLQPIPSSPDVTTVRDATAYDKFYPYTSDPNITKPVRYECWYAPADTFNNKANYGWAGCCNDPATQSDSVNASGVHVQGYGSTLHSWSGNIYSPGPVAGFNPEPSWYVYDPGGVSESQTQVMGFSNVVGNTPTAKVLSGLPDGNYSDLQCRPFKDVRDAARRFIKSLDFVRGDRIVLVTFDSKAQLIKPYGSSVEIITDKTAAIRALNMQVGVEVNPRAVQELGSCQSWKAPKLDDGFPSTDGKYFPDVNRRNVQSYWSVAQCPDTNMGGGILAATSGLVNPNWIRREAVWVMVILSDGFPNRTPSVGDGGIGFGRHPMNGTTEGSWMQVDLNDAVNSYSSPNLASCADSTYAGCIEKYCDEYMPGSDPADPNRPRNPFYALQPQWCATNATPIKWGLQSNSFGFCPWWTLCDIKSASNAAGEDYPRLSQCIENQPRAPWQGATNESFSDGGPYCLDRDPDSRHFCQDGTGRINPRPGLPPDGDSPNPTDYYCDPHYDADDYARDRADFAGLINFMDRSSDPGNPAKKGNFIAMYSIFFAHANQTLTSNMLGVKTLRYIADAGDNGIIDNHIQRFYRDVRDGVIPPNAVAPGVAGRLPWENPPTGQNESSGVQYVTSSGGVDSFNVGASNKLPQPTNGFGQPVPPTYNGADPIWQSPPYNYPALEDACAPYDYQENGGWSIPNREALAKTDCGQFFFADSPAKVNKAFTEIASRLFTRLSR
jgi:Flp pilus assembly protein TadG